MSERPKKQPSGRRRRRAGRRFGFRRSGSAPSARMTPTRGGGKKPTNERARKRRATLFFRWGVFVTALILVLFTIHIFRALYEIQIRDHRIYAERAAEQHMRRSVTYPPRGRITSANGETLAMTTYVYTVGITPSAVRSGRPRSEAPEAEDIAAEVGEILDIEPDEVLEALGKKDRTYIMLKRDVPRPVYDELKAYLKAQRLGGFAIDTNMKRYYPQDSLASQVVGFANRRSDTIEGVTGAEAHYNEALAGSPGYTYSERDNLSRVRLPGGKEAAIEEVPGYDLELTIDTRIQRVVEEWTDWARDTFHPQEGLSAIVMDPYTGAILGMAGGNNYNLNAPAAAPDGIEPDDWNPSGDPDDMDYMTSKIWNNYSTQTSYEPGSVMKVFTASMALEEHVYGAGERLTNEPIWVEGWSAYPISSSVQVPMTQVTLPEALRYSLNPPFVVLSSRLGVDTFYDYVRRLGFRDYTGIDLPGEGHSLIHSNPKPIDMATFSFGEQSTITPIQLARAYSVIANGGELIVPHVGRRLLDQDGQTIKELTPEPVRRVFSETTTETVRRMMTDVPKYGTGTEIYIPGYHVAAKTGTSTHGDNEELHMITVASITPAEAPKYVIVTSLFVPEMQEGSWPTQILNRKINEAIGPMMGVEADYTEYDLTRLFTPQPLNEMVGEDLAFAKRIEMLLGYNMVHEEGMTDETIVKSQYPPTYARFGYYGTFWVGATEDPIDEFVDVPDFTGLTFEEAFKLAEESGLNISLLGENRLGTITSQNVTAKMDVEMPPTGELPVNPAESTEGLRVRKYSVIDVHFDGTGSEGPKDDGTVLEGVDIPER